MGRGFVKLKSCSVCAKIFGVYSNDNKQRTTCSVECRRKLPAKSIPCTKCGRMFRSKAAAYSDARARQAVCKTCKNRAKHLAEKANRPPTRKIACNGCGKMIQAGRLYCSRQCKHDHGVVGGNGRYVRLSMSDAGYRYGDEAIAKIAEMFPMVRSKHSGRVRGHVDEHRIVMALHLGRVLRKDEHVHHLNGNYRDNRIENLELMSRAEHSRRHEEARHVADAAISQRAKDARIIEGLSMMVLALMRAAA